MSTAQALPLPSETFDDVTALPGSGWAQINHSIPAGTTSWFQGNAAIFPAQAGATTAYIAANFNNADTGGPTSGRFAFRFSVPDTSVNAGYVGTETVTVTLAVVPEAVTLAHSGGARGREDGLGTATFHRCSTIIDGHRLAYRASSIFKTRSTFPRSSPLSSVRIPVPLES